MNSDLPRAMFGAQVLNPEFRATVRRSARASVDKAARDRPWIVGSKAKVLRRRAHTNLKNLTQVN